MQLRPVSERFDKFVSTTLTPLTHRLLGHPTTGGSHGANATLPLAARAPSSPALGKASEVDLGPVGLVLVGRRRLVEDIEARLGRDSVQTLWMSLRRMSTTMAAAGSDEDRWRYLHDLWFSDSYNEIIEPMLADVAGPLAAMAAVLAEGQISDVAHSAFEPSAVLSANEIKGRGAVVMLLLAAVMGGYIRARRLSVSSVYLVVIGLVTLWDESIEPSLTDEHRVAEASQRF